ncbi:hypothetical protein, partial [Klebsiella pneumoniae]|uniref:hypothetical protein n=1 Tax=Klebsiella pneumoniae TaxID=573 RepID=UPI0030DAF0B4
VTSKSSRTTFLHFTPLQFCISFYPPAQAHGPGKPGTGTCAVRQTQTGKTERKRAEKEAAAQSFCRLNACKNFETG